MYRSAVELLSSTTYKHQSELQTSSFPHHYKVCTRFRINHQKMSQEKDIREFFDAMDADKSGSICAKEVENLLLAMGYPPDLAKTDAKGIMEECDKNGDDKISWAEFEAALAKKKC